MWSDTLALTSGSSGIIALVSIALGMARRERDEPYVPALYVTVLAVTLYLALQYLRGVSS